MIYVGKIGNKGLEGSAYREATPAVATHIKVKGKKSFIERKSIKRVFKSTTTYDDGVYFVKGKNGKMYPFSTEIIRKKGTDDKFANSVVEIATGDYVIRSGGADIELERTIYQAVDKSALSTSDELICETEDGLYQAEKELYSKVSFMSDNANGTGEYVCATDGTYVKKADLQIPAYKKLEATDTANIRISIAPSGGVNVSAKPKVMLDNGDEIDLPDNRVWFDGTNWWFKDDRSGDGAGDGRPQQCKYFCQKVNLDGFLVDGQIMNPSLISVSGNEYSIGGKKVAQNEASTKGVLSGVGFYARSSIGFTPQRESFLRQENQIDTGNLVYNFPKIGTDGLMRVEINRSRTHARFIYEDRIVDYYTGETPPRPIKIGKNLTESKSKGKEKFFIDKATGELKRTEQIQVDGFSLKTDKASGKVSFDYVSTEFERQEFAQDTSSFSIGDERIEDVKWDENGRLAGYKFRGCTVSVSYNTSGVAKYTITNEAGEKVPVKDLKNSKEYSHLYLECELVKKLEDIEWENGVITSFKLGTYELSDIEWSEQAVITKCTIKDKEGTTTRDVTIDDSRYGNLLKQLQVKVTTILEKDGITPLSRTSLFSKEGDKVGLNADYVAGESENGVAEATKVESMQQALAEQEKYAKEPYATHIVDENGTVRKIDDVKTTYDATSEFVNEEAKKVLDKIIGGYNITYSKDEFDVKRSEPLQQKVDLTMQAGVVLCSTVVLAPLGVAFLVGSALYSITDRIRRFSVKHKMKNLDYDIVTNKLQEKAEDQCKADINKLVKETTKQIKHAKKEFSSSELEGVLAKIKAGFVSKYNVIASTLEMLEQSELQSRFNLAKGGKVKEDNLLAVLYCEKKRREAVQGKDPHADYDELMRGLESSKLEEFYKSTLGDEGCEAYDAMTEEEKAAALKEFKKGMKDDEALKKGFEEYSIKEKVRVMEELGGRKGMIEAQKLKLKHMEMFLTQEQMEEYENADKKDKKKLLKQYKRALKKEFVAGGAKWGNADEQARAITLTEEYRMETSWSKRRAMVSEKRQQIIEASRNISTETVEMPERLNSTEESRGKELGKAVSAYLAICCAQMFTTENIPVNSPLYSGDAHTPKPFDYDLVKEMSSADKALYLSEETKEVGSAVVGPEDLTGNVTEAVGVVDVVEKKVADYADRINQIAENVVGVSDDYVEILKLWAVADMDERLVEEACRNNEAQLTALAEARVIDAGEKDRITEENQENFDTMRRVTETIKSKRDMAKKEMLKIARKELWKKHRETELGRNVGVDEKVVKRRFLLKNSLKVALRVRENDETAKLEEEAFIEHYGEKYELYAKNLRGKYSEEQIQCMFVEGLKMSEGFMYAPEIQAKFADKVRAHYGLGCTKEKTDLVKTEEEVNGGELGL